MRQNFRIISGLAVLCLASYITRTAFPPSKYLSGKLKFSLTGKLFKPSHKRLRFRLGKCTCRSKLGSALDLFSHNKFQKEHVVALDIRTKEGYERVEVAMSGRRYNFDTSADFNKLLEENKDDEEFKLLALWVVIFGRRGKYYRGGPLSLDSEALTQCLVNNV
ncbi:hypothetical protein PMYN1_Chma109 (chromatophore) [Paulinella micropora]|uniref:Uncharacterized protein n=1 Tax=Paulinella micropora TaxID=1928728 RepID=A0A5K7VRQ7_9EUKA|nr:hypothetical protein PMYN1_Chma109 [Paulinella micropora]